MQRLKFNVVLLIAAGVAAVAGYAFAQSAPGAAGKESARRPALLFKEEWKLPPHEGPPSDDNQRVNPGVVGNSQLEVKFYGRDSAAILAWEHEGRHDLWTGLTKSPVAVTLRHKTSYMDLTGLARLRWIVRTNAIHTLYPVVRLADGTLIVGNRGISTDGEFLEVEVAFGGMKWFKLDPANVVVTSEVKNPDLSKVDEVGLVTLAPAGGHGTAGSANMSTVELFAKAVPR